MDGMSRLEAARSLRVAFGGAVVASLCVVPISCRNTGGSGGDPAAATAGPPAAGAQAIADVLPPERRTTWSPGIRGGIPARTTVCAAVDAAGSGNGAVDATARIQAAIDACPAGQVVQLSAGEFLVNGDHPITINRGV